MQKRQHDNTNNGNIVIPGKLFTIFKHLRDFSPIVVTLLFVGIKADRIIRLLEQVNDKQKIQQESIELLKKDVLDLKFSNKNTEKDIQFAKERLKDIENELKDHEYESRNIHKGLK